MSKKFQRQIEDFTCAKCGATVMGDGYTNHCPQCLYSCHVDNNPGDRESDCGGMMTPVALGQKDGEWVVSHQCKKCGVVKRCKTRDEDGPAVIKLAAALAHKNTH